MKRNAQGRLVSNRPEGCDILVSDCPFAALPAPVFESLGGEAKAKKVRERQAGRQTRSTTSERRRAGCAVLIIRWLGGWLYVQIRKRRRKEAREAQRVTGKKRPRDEDDEQEAGGGGGKEEKGAEEEEAKEEEETEGFTPLHTAAFAGDAERVGHAGRQQQVEEEEAMGGGRKGLRCAVCGVCCCPPPHHHQVSGLLSEEGVDVAALDAKGRTALDVARDQGHQQVGTRQAGRRAGRGRGRGGCC